MGEPPIRDFKKYINFTGMADGMVGGVLPNVVFYFPILPQNDSISNEGGSRYWTMIASPIADMLGGQCLTTLSPPPSYRESARGRWWGSFARPFEGVWVKQPGSDLSTQ